MHKGKNMLIKATILSFTFIVGVFVMTAAWFTSSQTATASGLSVKAKKSEGLQISDGISDWKYELTYDKLQLPLVTSSNGKDFQKPLLHMTTGEPVEGGGNVTADETDYIEKTIYFRSDKPMMVSISELTVSPFVTDVSDSKNSASKSPYGNFSIDYIAAAARISITNGETTTVYDPNPKIELKGYGTYTEATSLTNNNIVIFTDNNSCFYSLMATSDTELRDMPISMKEDGGAYKGNPVPEQMFVIGKNGDIYTFKSLKHSDMFLHYNSTDKKFDLSKTATSFTIENGSLKVSGENISDVYLSYDGNSFVPVETAPATATVKMLTSEPCTIDTSSTNEQTYVGSVKTKFTDLQSASAVTLTPTEGDTYYKGQITLRIWAEGTDRDALVPLMGGKFSTSIEFSGTVTTETSSQEG